MHRSICASLLKNPTYCSARDAASNTKIRLQSSFMLMTVQPCFFASS